MVGDNSKDYKNAVLSFLKNEKIEVKNDDIKAALAELSVKKGVSIKKSDNSWNLIVNDQDFTWHHHQDGKTMQMVAFDAHKRGTAPHTGGAKLVKSGIGKIDPNDPNKVNPNKGLFPSPSMTKFFKNCKK